MAKKATPMIDPALIERLERALRFGTEKRFLAVPIDLGDVETVLTLLKGGANA